MAGDWAPPETDFQTATTADSGHPLRATSTGKPTEATAPDETVARVAGLAARGLATGAAGVPNAVSISRRSSRHGAQGGSADCARDAPETGSDPPDATSAPAPPSHVPQKPRLQDFVHPDKWQAAAEYFADKAGSAET